MALVSLQNLCLTFAGSEIFSGIDLQIEKKQRIGLLGRNGSGKTTLMRTIAGEIKPDSGQVQVSQGVKIAYFAQDIPQQLEGSVFEIVARGLGEKGRLLVRYHQTEKSQTLACEKTLDELAMLRKQIDQHDAWVCLDEIGRVTSSLAISQDWLYQDLSGGQKRRVLLAAALVTAPDVLLLDEPTNHLDIDTIAWLEDFLMRANMTILFVTHDRMLLRRLADRIVELDRGRIYDWECDYDKFLLRKDELLAAEAKEWERFDKKLANEEVWIRKGIKARRTRNEGRVRALKKMREERRQRRNHVGKVSMQINKADNSGRDVICAEKISFSYDQKKIIDNFSLKIVRGDKIGIVGANGCGKTTLVKLLIGQLQPHAGGVSHGTNLEIAYYDQMRADLDEQKTIWENVSPSGDTLCIGGQNVHVITYLQNFLFAPERARSKISILSGGERNRVMLAKLFSSPANLLVLDEPTNDLDIETLELLEEMLVDFAGTVLIICHDRTFLNNVVSSTVVFAENGEVKEIIGGYDDWLAERKVIAAEKANAEKKAKALETQRPSSKVKLSFKEKQELQSLPRQIEEAETEIAELHQSMSDPEFFKSAQNAIDAQNRLTELEENLMIYLQRWEELESKEALISQEQKN